MLITTMKDRREAMGLTQAKLAELTGIRRETLVRLERGYYNPSLKLAMKIALILSCTVEDLFEFPNLADELPQGEEKDDFW